MITRPDEQKILAQTHLESFHFYQSLASTNDTARALADDTAVPALVIAAEQFAGRGQNSNRWWSGPGSLTCSWITNTNQEVASNLSALAAAVAASNAIRSIDAALKPTAKWPNDIYLGQSKVAGILVETILVKGTRKMIVGIGVNTNCSIKDAPPELRSKATSVCDHLDRKIDQDRFLISLINEFHAQFTRLENDSASILDDFRSISMFRPDQKISWSTAGKRKETGKFAGIGSHGELLVRLNAQTHKIISATIEEFQL